MVLMIGRLSWIKIAGVLLRENWDLCFLQRAHLLEYFPFDVSSLISNSIIAQNTPLRGSIIAYYMNKEVILKRENS